MEKLYTLETPSGSLTLVKMNTLWLLKKSPIDGRRLKWSSFQTDNVFFEQLDGIEWGNEDDSLNHYLVRLKEDNQTFEYVPITNGVEETNEDEPVYGMFPVRSFDVEESDLFMVNRFVVHNFFNGDEGCSVQYNNVPRCSGYGPASFAFEDVRPNNVSNLVFVITLLIEASFPSGTHYV